MSEWVEGVLARPAALDVVCIGILVADTVARPVGNLPPRGQLGMVEQISLHVGGCAANTASWLVRLGLRTGVVGQVGQDAFGDYVLAVLERRGVDTQGVLRTTAALTSATVVLVDDAGERTFLHAFGASGVLTSGALDRSVLLRGRALHVGGALVMPALDGEPLAAVLEEAQRRGVVTSLDTVWDASGRWSRIEPCLPYLDIFLGNLGETAAITGCQDPEAAAAWLRARGTGEVAIKLGGEGCYLAGEDDAGHVPPVKVDVVDGTGAGDAFTAAYLFARLARWPLLVSGRFANAAGAVATTAIGASDVTASAAELRALAGLDAP